MLELLSEESLRAATLFLVRIVEAAGVLVIFSGAGARAQSLLAAREAEQVATRASRRCASTCGRFLALGLEFQLAADLLRTCGVTHLPGDRKARVRRRDQDRAQLLPDARDPRESADRVTKPAERGETRPAAPAGAGRVAGRLPGGRFPVVLAKSRGARPKLSRAAGAVSAISPAGRDDRGPMREARGRWRPAKSKSERSC